MKLPVLVTLAGFLGLSVYVFSLSSYEGTLMPERNDSEAGEPRAVAASAGFSSSFDSVTSGLSCEADSCSYLADGRENPEIIRGKGGTLVQPAISGRSVPAPEIAARALALLEPGAEPAGKDLLDELSRVNQDAPWSNSFYEQVRSRLSDIQLDASMRKYLAQILAQSGRSDSLNTLVSLMEQAAANPEMNINPSAYAKALGQAKLPSEILDQIATDLESNNRYLREAAVSLLTEQGTLAATKRLFNHTIERGDPDGYYRDGIGIGEMKPKPETFAYLEQAILNRDQYSHLAVKALLNYGSEGLQKVVTLLNQSGSPELDSKILKNAIDHIKSDTATLDYVKGLSNSPNPAIKELANNVLREHDIDVKSLHMKIEYNENWEKGLVY